MERKNSGFLSAQMIKINYIPNILNKRGRFSSKYKSVRGFTIKKYVDVFCKEHNVERKNMRVIVRATLVKDFGQTVRDGEEIIITPKVGDPIGALIYFLTASLFVQAQIVFAVASIALTAYSIYQAITAGQPKLPSFGSLTTDGSLEASSPTYGWEGIRSTQDVGIPIRILYGEHRVGGNIINQYVRTNGDKQYLNLLFGICEGEVESISDMKINQNPAANFDGITTTTRPGTNNQAVIPNFQDQHSVVSLNAHLVKDDPYTTTTILTDVEAFELTFSLPNGLFQVDSQGAVSSWQVDYKVEYRVSGGGAYTNLGTTSINDKNKTAVKRVFRKAGLSPAQYDIKVTRTSQDPTIGVPQKVGDLYLTAVDEITTEDLAYPNLALVAVEALATDQLSGATPNFTFLVKGLKIRVPDVRYSGNAIAWEDYYWDDVALAFKRLSDSGACTWDGVTFITAYCANPVWCMRDLLTNTRYGLGEYIDTSAIDDDVLLEMAKECDLRVADGFGGYEKKHRLDVSIDSLSSAVDVVTQLTATFRAFAFYTQGTVKISIDRPDDIVQVFGMGNIVKSSFIQNWKSWKERPNVLEITFNDKNKDYEQEIASIVDEESLTAGEQIRKKTIRLFCTRLSQALREGRFALNVGKNVKRFVVLKSAIEAVVCQSGDLIGVSHDIPQIGFSGRVVAGSTTTRVMLDRSIIVEGGKTYVVMVRFADDTIVEKAVTNAAGTYNYVDVGSAFGQAPAAFDIYAFGETNIETKPFRVVGIRRESRGDVEITGIEYIPAIYTADAIVVPENNYSALSLAVPFITGLSLTERDTRLSDGSVQIAIDVYFRRPELAAYRFNQYVKARVYISDDAGASWRFAAETTGEYVSITKDVAKSTNYKVAVASVGGAGFETAVALSPSASIAVSGKNIAPSDVSSFVVNQSRDRLLFGWAHVTDVDLSGYEIRYGDSWGAGTVLATGLKNNTFSIFNFRIGSSQSYWIKAIDTSGNYSTNATEGVITIDNIPFTNTVNQYAEETGWSGTKVDTEISGDNLILSTGKLTGTYETGVKDIGFVATAKIGIEQIVTAGGDRRFDSDAAATFADSPTDRFSGAELAGAATFEIKTSEDNVTWTAYAAWVASDYRFRYFQIRMTLTRDSLDIDLQCSQFDYYVDLPDVDEYGSGSVSDTTNGLDVTFAKTFFQEPVVAISILSGTGVYWRVSSKDTAGFTIKLYDVAGVSVTGDFEFHAHGV